MPLMARCSNSRSTAPSVAPSATMSRVSVHTSAFNVRVSKSSRRYWTSESMPLSAGIFTKPAAHAAHTLSASM
eukprot:14295249-Alexandrium_andersonii.AAC.1